MNWGDIQDDESSIYIMPASHSTNQGLQMPAVPASIVSKVDAAGVRKVVEYGTNEKGQKIKITNCGAWFAELLRITPFSTTSLVFAAPITFCAIGPNCLFSLFS